MFRMMVGVFVVVLVAGANRCDAQENSHWELRAELDRDLNELNAEVKTLIQKTAELERSIQNAERSEETDEDYLRYCKRLVDIYRDRIKRIDEVRQKVVKAKQSLTIVIEKQTTEACIQYLDKILQRVEEANNRSND